MKKVMGPGRSRAVSGPGVAMLLVWGALMTWPAAAGAATAGPAGGEILPGKGVGPISIGMTVDDVFRRWGPPERTERDQDGVVLYDYGDAKGVGVFLAGERVFQILVVSREWSTPNGVKVGATRSEMTAFFGPPDQQMQSPATDEIRYWYRRRGLVFVIKQRTVVGIGVIAAEGEAPRPDVAPDEPGSRKPFLPTPR